MLQDRIIGAFTFRKGVYAEVEKDTSFTTTAWLLVAVVTFINQIGSRANSNVFVWLLGAIVFTVVAVVAFGVGAYAINWAGRALYNADVTFEELVRTLGLASVWQVIGFFGILPAFIGFLACFFTPIVFLSLLAMLAAWLIAAKEALDLEWVETIITVVIGWVVYLIVMAIAGAILGLLGLGAATAISVFGF